MHHSASRPVSGRLVWIFGSREMFEYSQNQDRLRPAAARNIPYGNDGASTTDPQPMLPSPDAIVAHLSRHVIGHESAKRTLAVACYNHFLQCACSDRVCADNHVLIAGPSGCGKSAMIEALGGILHVPILQIDCAVLSPTGYKGRDLNQIIESLEERFVDGDRTRPGILVWEEIDKLRDDGFQAGSYRALVQCDALRLLEGAFCGSEGNLDASRILNIGCGAFIGLDDIRDSGRKSVIGFGNPAGGKLATRLAEPLPPVLPEHFVQFGLMPEFVGRFSRLATLEPLDAPAMRRVLVEAEGGVLDSLVEVRRKAAGFFTKKPAADCESLSIW